MDREQSPREGGDRSGTIPGGGADVSGTSRDRPSSSLLPEPLSQPPLAYRVENPDHLTVSAAAAE
jgi:hypothetical protein